MNEALIIIVTVIIIIVTTVIGWLSDFLFMIGDAASQTDAEHAAYSI